MTAALIGRPKASVRRRRLTIVVSSAIAAVPRQGGWTWLVLHYLLGLRRLGHRVVFLETIDRSALRPIGASLASSVNAGYFRRVVRAHGFADDSALRLDGTGETVGMSAAELLRVMSRADLLLNLSGALRDEALTARIPVRVYLDLDPGFTQLWQAVQGIDMNFGGHTHHATIGLGIGQPGCDVPTCGLRWIPTPQPVVLSKWPVGGRVRHRALTTIANWRGYGSVQHDGKLYGQKAHSVRQYISLPARCPERLLLALAIHPDEGRDLDALTSNGWEMENPDRVAGTPTRYRSFVRGSWAELAIAKTGYVHANCGWFSDRSICYLASGRPVIAQETGFSRFIPTGRGLHAFSDEEGALAAVDAVRSDYAAHSRAARALAEEFFDSDRVLPRLLSAVDCA